MNPSTGRTFVAWMADIVWRIVCWGRHLPFPTDARILPFRHRAIGRMPSLSAQRASSVARGNTEDSCEANVGCPPAHGCEESRSDHARALVFEAFPALSCPLIV